MRNNQPAPATLLAAILASEPHSGGAPQTAYGAAMDAERLVRLGGRAARLAAQRCNGVPRWDAESETLVATWTEADSRRADAAAAKIKGEASAILAGYGASEIDTFGDPRGHVLSWRLASGRSNSIAGDRWGI